MKGVALIILIFILALFIAPLVDVHAQGGLIPCGRSGDGPGSEPCTFCHLYQLVKKTIDFLILVIMPLGVLALAWGGITFITAGGSEANVARGKEIIWNTIVGIIIALAAWLIVNTILATLIDPSSSLTAWYEFPQCPSPGS